MIFVPKIYEGPKNDILGEVVVTGILSSFHRIDQRYFGIQLGMSKMFNEASKCSFVPRGEMRVKNDVSVFL